jgi:hypothetical protein
VEKLVAEYEASGLEYGPGRTYNGLGFVWGRERGGGNWKFYVHAIPPAASFGSTTEDRKWAEPLRNFTLL